MSAATCLECRENVRDAEQLLRQVEVYRLTRRGDVLPLAQRISKHRARMAVHRIALHRGADIEART